MSTRVRWLLASGLASCGGDTSSPVDAPMEFARAVALPLSAKCGTCHGSSAPAAGLTLSGLSTEELKRALVGVMSSQAPTVALVSPGEPEASYLVLKVRGALLGVACPSGCGQQMPIGGAYPAADRDALVAWISGGAL